MKNLIKTGALGLAMAAASVPSTASASDTFTSYTYATCSVGTCTLYHCVVMPYAGPDLQGTSQDFGGTITSCTVIGTYVDTTV